MGSRIIMSKSIKVKYLFLSALSVVSTTLCAANADSIQAEAKAWESPWRSFSNYFEYNPAASFSVPVYDYSVIKSSYSSSKADAGMHSAYEGNGTSAFNLKSESYSKSAGQSFFGEASFQSDQRNNVKWRDVEDYEILSPYLVADSIGGTYKGENYSLGGGTTFCFKGFELGFRANYRGRVSYRQVDPRPLNTVSVISLNPGIVYTSGNWKYGWFGKYERYRQNVDIDVEKEDRKIYFYLLQGFGIYNRQFSVLDETFKRIYKGNSYQTGFHLNNIGKNQSTGALFAMKRAIYKVDEFDRRTPYILTHNELETEVTHEQNLFGKTLFINGSYNLHQAIGNESQYKPVTVQTNFIVWKFVTQSDRYQSLDQTARISLLLADKKQSVFSIWERIDGLLQDSRQYYYSPDYHQSVKDITGSGTIGFNCPLSKSSLEGGIEGGYKKVLSSSLLQEENNKITNEMIVPDFNYLKTDYAFYTLNLKFRLPLSHSLNACLSANGGLLKAKDKQSWFGCTSIALNF